MRIVIDCRMLNSSGIGTYLQGVLIYLIGNELHNFLLLGDEQVLKKYSKSNVLIENIDIEIFSFRELYFFPTKKINKYDAFLTPNFNIPFGIRIPIYCFIHDVVFLDVRSITSKLGYLIRKFYISRAYDISKKIFTVSKFSKSRITHFFGTKKEIIVAYGSIKNDLINFKSNYRKKDDFILFVGNVKKHKGLDVLVKAWEYAKSRGFNKKLIIIGQREGFKTSDNAISVYEQDGIDFTGKISDEELYDYIEKAHVLVQPSNYEGFGLPPLEALYMGTTCLISNIPVFKEVYSFFDNCYFFKVGDSKDLGEKLLSVNSRKINQKSQILDSYNFEKSASIIINEIQ